MRSIRTLNAVAALLTVGALAACNLDTNEPTLVTSRQITADVLDASGEAIAADVGELVGNEAFGVPVIGSPEAGVILSNHPAGMNVTRSRTCFDGSGNQQTQCDPLTTASVVLTMSMNGSFSRSFTRPDGETVSFTAKVSRARTMTISGLLGTETSRTHNGVGASSDTTVFTHPQGSRTMREASADSVKNVVFNLPRSTNPWPASGQIVRAVTGSMTVVHGERTETREFSRRVVVTFPADNQGNVTIQVNDRTCTLNLVTRRIVNCSN